MAVAGVEQALRGRNRPSWNGYQRDENTEKAADWITLLRPHLILGMDECHIGQTHKAEDATEV